MNLESTYRRSMKVLLHLAHLSVNWYFNIHNDFVHISNKVYVVLILRLSEIRKTVVKLMDIARVIKARRTVHGNTLSAINILGDPGTASRDNVFYRLPENIASSWLAASRSPSMCFN